MKKVILAFFALIYLSTSIGVTVTMHYCMGKLTGFDLSAKKTANCSKCGMDKTKSHDNDCCKDEQKFVQNTIDQKLIDTSIGLTQLFGIALPQTFGELPAVHISSVTEDFPIGHAPPRSSSIALFIRNCSYLI